MAAPTLLSAYATWQGAGYKSFQNIDFGDDRYLTAGLASAFFLILLPLTAGSFGARYGPTATLAAALAPQPSRWPSANDWRSSSQRVLRSTWPQGRRRSAEADCRRVALVVFVGVAPLVECQS